MGRKVRESTKLYLDEVHVLSYINIIKDSLWPGGRLRPETGERTHEEKMRTRDDANRKLTALLPGQFENNQMLHRAYRFPDVAANMMGRSNARRGARRIFAVLQNRRLNQHIVYTIMDEVSRICLAFVYPLTQPSRFSLLSSRKQTYH